MRAAIGVGFLSAIGLAHPTIISYPHRIFDKLESIPRDWKLHREATHDEPIVLHVSLPSQNVDLFHQRVIDVSTPGHPSYGQHLEGHESCNITSVTSNDDWVTFRTSVGAANKLLRTKFSWFINERHEPELRTTEYSIPNRLSRHVDFVHPTIKFPSITQLKSTIHLLGKPKVRKLDHDLSAVSTGSTACGKYITPQCLFKLYNIHYGAEAKNGNVMSYASFLKQSARYAALAGFERHIAQYAIGQNFTVHPFPPAKNDQTSHRDASEADIDNQYSVGLTYPTPVEEFITAGCGPETSGKEESYRECSNEPYMSFLDNILALPNSALPQTLSVSYADDEQTWPRAMARKVCTGFAQLGARGVSVIFASGDSGPGEICENNAGTKKEFIPQFPPTCPFITSVGATKGINPEKAARFSSGGFSNYFTRPSYQDKVVSAFLTQLGSKFQNYYNASGRGFPDVSAQGFEFSTWEGGLSVVSGTSCSAPTFSSVISLLNSALISNGKKPLGYLNPFLYSTGTSGLMDVTSGKSSGCIGGKLSIKGAGWKAVKGWDPVTGLGTPNFGKLLSIVAPGVRNKGGPVGA